MLEEERGVFQGKIEEFAKEDKQPRGNEDSETGSLAEEKIQSARK